MQGVKYYSIIILALTLAAASAFEWQPATVDLFFVIPYKENYTIVYQLVNDSPFFYEFRPESLTNCSKLGISVSRADSVSEDPLSSYNFTITLDIGRFDHIGYFKCNISAINLYAKEVADLPIRLRADSHDCTYNPSVCSETAFCNQTTHRCNCLPNYHGFNCGYYCNSNVTCGGNGECNGWGSCSCYQGFTGKDCSTICDPKTNCSGNGYCRSNGCECNEGYYGDRCEKTCDPCVNGYCSLNGACTCHKEYYGPACQYTCNDCQMHGGGCTNTTQCLCPGLKYGDICQNDLTLLVVSLSICGALSLSIRVYYLGKWKYANAKRQKGYEAVN